MDSSQSVLPNLRRAIVLGPGVLDYAELIAVDSAGTADGMIVSAVVGVTATAPVGVDVGLIFIRLQAAKNAVATAAFRNCLRLIFEGAILFLFG